MPPTATLLSASGGASAQPRPAWYTSDFHVHANGCGGAETPASLLAQLRASGVNVGHVLIWGGSARTDAGRFAEQVDDPISDAETILHWDIEISLLPGEENGHLLLLNVGQLDTIEPFFVRYPGQDYFLPNYARAHAQGALVGYAHGGQWTAGSYEPGRGGDDGPLELPLDAVLERVDFLSTKVLESDGFRWLWYSMLDASLQISVPSSRAAVAVEVDAASAAPGAILELVVNGRVVETAALTATLTTYRWSVPLAASSWIAARTAAAHTAATFVLRDGCPIRNDPAAARRWMGYLDLYFAYGTSMSVFGDSANTVRARVEEAKGIWERIALEGEGSIAPTCGLPPPSDAGAPAVDAGRPDADAGATLDGSAPDAPPERVPPSTGGCSTTARRRAAPAIPGLRLSAER